MLFQEAKAKAYKLHRGASQGAGITLVAGCGEYTATYECASRIAKVLGSENLQDYGDGIYESIPAYHIPFHQMHNACTKLSSHHSIALIDYAHDKHGGRYFLLWRIPHLTNSAVKTATTNLDEF